MKRLNALFLLFILCLFHRTTHSFIRSYRNGAANLSPATKLVIRGHSRCFLLDRFFRVVASNINSVLKKMEDPEKMIEQAVIDMQNDLVRIRQSYAEVSATQKRMENQRKQALTSATEWYDRAKLAVEKGDDDLAKEALQRRNLQLEIVENLEKQLVVQAEATNKLYSSMGELEVKISEAKRQKDTFVARAKTAKTSMEVNDMLASISGKSSMEVFERMKEKVESLEVQAEISSSMRIDGGDSVESKFRRLEKGDEIDAELQSLKYNANRSFPQLPPSTSDNIYQLERLKETKNSPGE